MLPENLHFRRRSNHDVKIRRQHDFLEVLRHSKAEVRPISRFQAYRILILGVCLLAFALLIPGCGNGTGTLSLSGGGFPIGGSRLFGRAVSAIDVTKPIANAKIVVEATSVTGGTQILEMTADSKGAFEFPRILAGQSGGTLVVSASVADNSYQAQRISFQSVAGTPHQALLTLAPAGFDVTQVKTVSLSLASSGIASGNSASLNAKLRDANGMIVNASPTLLYSGNFGTLNDDGTFSVSPNIAAGSGSVTAYWNGVTPQSTQIQVDNNAPQQPPAIPATLDGVGTKQSSIPPDVSASIPYQR